VVCTRTRWMYYYCYYKALPFLDEPRGTTGGESNVDALAVEDGPDLPSKSDSVLRGRGPSSALALLLDRRASERVPAAPIAFHPVGSSIGSHVLSASRISMGAGDHGQG
jgi:hypothetical protein